MAITQMQESILPNNNPLMATPLPPAYFCQPPRPRTKEFLCNILFGDPKVLGMIHIMTSLATAAFGIVATLKYKSMWNCPGLTPSTNTVISGIAIWGPVIYVGTGVISIMTYRGFSRDLAICAVYMNIFSCLIASIAAILLTVDLVSTLDFPCYEIYLDEVHGIQGALFFFDIIQFSNSVLGAMVIKYRAQSASDPQLDSPLYVNEPVAGPFLPISQPTQGIYTTMMPVAPPPEYTP